MSDFHQMESAVRDLEEEALVRGLSVGDPRQVEKFIKRSHRPVYAMTARLTTDPDLRHDWSQDILLKVLQEMSSGRFVYQRPGCFWAWFQMRTNFLLINLYHQHKKHTERWSTGEVGTAIVENMPINKGRDPMRLLEDVESRRVVEECLDELSSEDHRRAMYLYLFQEQAYQEVADVMNTTLNTVRSWIRRARINMRQCVARKFGYPHEQG